jgi:predicted transposase YbfD/YdcC
MDKPEYTSLRDALSDVPDPRQRRGQRHAWPLLLTLIAAALVSGQRGLRAIGQWVDEHADDLCLVLQPPRGRLPSPSTLRRAVHAVDVVALEARLASFVAGLPTSPAAPTGTAPVRAGWVGQALDGKRVRGANRHGARVHLVSLVRHADGLVLDQLAVADKSNEIPAAPRLLAGRDLTGTVTTLDAQLTQRALAQQICQQGGHYLMIVKANQPDLYGALERLFRTPLVPDPTDYVAAVTTVTKGHGRLETRTLERSAALNTYLDWPSVGQALRRTCRRVILTTGQVQEEVTYGLTSLPPITASVGQVEALWRGHWTIENRVHYVRDVTFGEDAGQQRTGATPQALAALRNGLLSLLRALGWTNIADAVRHYGAYAHRALHLLTRSPARL